MKKLPHIFTKSADWMLAGILSLLGFSSCEPSADMYGCPHANYTIKGKVINEVGASLPGIRVISPYEGAYQADTLFTNPAGEFTYTRGWLQLGPIPLLLSDIDGDKNGGSYASDSVSISFEDIKLTGGDGNWYKGEATKNAIIRLKKNTEEIE